MRGPRICVGERNWGWLRRTPAWSPPSPGIAASGQGSHFPDRVRVTQIVDYNHHLERPVRGGLERLGRAEVHRGQIVETLGPARFGVHGDVALRQTAEGHEPCEGHTGLRPEVAGDAEKKPEDSGGE